MESIIRCRKCGKKMKSVRVDDYRIKISCTCGFSEYRTAPSATRAINPHFSKESLLPLGFDESGRFFIETERANRERKEIITIEEISMLASSDYNLDSVLKAVVEKTAKRLGVDICSIYLWDGVCLVLRATYGLAQEAVGKARLNLGEGITGSAVKEKRPLYVEDISKDPRYRYFQETREEQYKIKTMYSYPMYSGTEPFGALNAQMVVTREFSEDEKYFVSVVANLILGAVKMRKKK
ncbi:MAG: GAF domain-containing protein [Deltaproteobacteria bacterium]|nr:GAF domain-containing protein [Deltaproteobacteria bacterium]